MRISFPVYPGSQPSVENHRGARLRGSLNDWRSRRGGCTGRSKGFLPTSFPPPGYWLVPSGVYPESGAARQGDSAFAERNTCSLAIRDVVAVPCSNGIVPYDTTINVCTELPDPVSLVLSAGASVHGRRYPAVTRAGDPRSVWESMAVPENRGVTGALRVPVPERFRNTSTVNPTGSDPHDTREMARDTSRSPFVSFPVREGGGHRVVSLRKGAGRRGDTGMRGSRNRSRASPRNLRCAAGCRTMR